MRSWCPNNNKKALQRKIDKTVREEYDKYSEEIFESCKRDIIAQLMAVCMTELNKEFGFGADRLKKFKRGVESLLVMMDKGVLFQGEATTQTCIDYIRDKFGVDLDKHNNKESDANGK